LTDLLQEPPQAELDLKTGLDSRARVETFHRSESGFISRLVRRRDGTEVNTEIGPDSRDSDLSRAADLSYLRLSSRPVNSGTKEVAVADLFSGCGGMSVGFQEACRAIGLTMKPVLACDTNQHARKVYADNFGIPEPPAIDLGRLSSLSDAPRTSFEVGLTRQCQHVDAVLAGPPCQGHSNLNNHTRRDDPKNALYYKVARFVRLFSPEIVLIENVPSVVKDLADVVGRTCEVLSRDYELRPYIVDLSQLGVPQKRKRHLLVAVRHGSGKALPSPTQLLEMYGVARRPALWAIQDIVDMASTDGDILDRVPKIADVTRERIEYLFRTGQYDLPNAQRPECHQGDHTYGSVYGRMRGDEPAPTITRGFGTMGQGRFVHPERERTLTPREAARLQFFPDYFSFRRVTSRKYLHELIGNAVPPKLSYVFGLELMR
jgi:DNA (cytosine-5)-methyltransferase 1